MRIRHKEIRARRKSAEEALRTKIRAARAAKPAKPASSRPAPRSGARTAGGAARTTTPRPRKAAAPVEAPATPPATE